jgi:hypothetical protein
MKHTQFVTVLFVLMVSVSVRDSISQVYFYGDGVSTANETGSKFVFDSKTIDIVLTLGQEQTGQSLLPDHYLFTQRWLWGENGLMRRNGKNPLTPEGREHEMDIRATMNKWHRIAGYTALAGMIGAGVSGQMLSNGNEGARTYHEVFTGLTNLTYFSSLTLSIFSPPPMKNREAGFTAFNVHRSLAVLHIASMLTTNILSMMLPDNPDLIPYHRAAAITAFSSLLIANVVINF